MERQLDYRVQYHCEEKNTRSLISRRKACQDKWVLTLSQANTNEKPRHGDLLLPSAVLALLWAGVSAWGCPLGEREDTKTKSWNMFLAAP